MSITQDENLMLELYRQARDKGLSNEAALAEVTSQLAAIPNQPIKSSLIGKSLLKPMILFTDDDAQTSFIDKWGAWINAGYPIVCSVVTNWVGLPGYMSYDELRTLQDAGVDMALHGSTHLGFNTLTYDEVYANISIGQAAFKSNGLKNWDVIVYPAGEPGANGRKASRNLCAIGFGVGDTSGIKINRPPLDTYYIYRGDITDSNPSNNLTYAQMTAEIDKIVEKPGLLVFLTHSYHAGFTSDVINQIATARDYAISKGVQIASLREAIDAYANRVDTLDDGVKLGADGRLYGTVANYSTLTIPHYYFSTFSEFPKNTLTIENVPSSSIGGFPSSGGIREVIATEAEAIDTFYQYGGTVPKVYKRKLLSTNVIPEFYRIQSYSSFTTSGRPVDCDAGYIGYDTSLNKPIMCKTPGSKALFEIKFNTGASASGNIAVGGATFAVTQGMSAAEVATAFEAASWIGYGKVKKPGTNIVYAFRAIPQSASSPTFTDTDSTGVTATINVVRTGASQEWVDYTGATV